MKPDDWLAHARLERRGQDCDASLEGSVEAGSCGAASAVVMCVIARRSPALLACVRLTAPTACALRDEVFVIVDACARITHARHMLHCYQRVLDRRKEQEQFLESHQLGGSRHPLRLNRDDKREATPERIHSRSPVEQYLDDGGVDASAVRQIDDDVSTLPCRCFQCLPDDLGLTETVIAEEIDDCDLRRWVPDAHSRLDASPLVEVVSLK